MNGDNHEMLSASLMTLSLKEGSTPSNSQGTTASDTIEENQHVTSLENSSIRRLPAHNVPEKVIFCIDTCLDPDYIPFKIGDSSFTPMFMLKRVCEFFAHNKHYMDSRHEFALLALDKNNINWLQEFTNLPRELISAVHDLKSECEQEEEYDLSVLLEAVWQMVSVPKPDKDINNPPPYIVRLIILYSRSHCIPVLKKSFKELLENPYFIIDTISVSEDPSENNKQKEIINNLQVDKKGLSYNFWVGRDKRKLHVAMGKLLGHPLQRPIQSQIISYASPVFKEEE